MPTHTKRHSLRKSGGYVFGRGRRIRTLGTRFWRPLLYQLSYTPMNIKLLKEVVPPPIDKSNKNVVGLQGLEPGTYRL